jgi:uncharacterized protein YdaU (DUF1376 family)
MNKSPAFQFYPDDFVGGSVGMMTPEEVGVYVLLLCLDWNQNGFIADPDRLARWCRITPKRFAAVWPVVGACFKERDGRFYSPRLEKERGKQAAWRQKSSEGGKLGADKRWHTDPKDHGGGHKGGHGGGDKGGHATPKGVVKRPPIPNDDILFPSLTPKDQLQDQKLFSAGAETNNWVAAATEIFLGVGTFPHGRIGKALAPVVKQYGWPETERGLRDYVCAPKNGRHRTPEYFAQESGTWVVGAREELVDATGVPTARADRLMGVS